MGQKSNPTGLRIGVIKTWSSKWCEEGNYAKWLKEDLRIKKFIKTKYGSTGINRIEIERAANKVKVSVFTAKPGVIIGSGLVFAIFRVLANYTWIQDIMFPKTEFAGIKDVFFMVPYIVTLIILIFASRRSNCPKAEGIPYEKGAR